MICLAFGSRKRWADGQASPCRKRSKCMIGKFGEVPGFHFHPEAQASAAGHVPLRMNKMS
eukprot:scaffold8451_cov128-Isochrysis_galbana.AAC.6